MQTPLNTPLFTGHFDFLKSAAQTPMQTPSQSPRNGSMTNVFSPKLALHGLQQQLDTLNQSVSGLEDRLVDQLEGRLVNQHERVTQDQQELVDRLSTLEQENERLAHKVSQLEAELTSVIVTASAPKILAVHTQEQLGNDMKSQFLSTKHTPHHQPHHTPNPSSEGQQHIDKLEDRISAVDAQLKMHAEQMGKLSKPVVEGCWQCSQLPLISSRLAALESSVQTAAIAATDVSGEVAIQTQLRCEVSHPIRCRVTATL